jgi:ribosomal protein S18 acetylase RimI-like enzyme
MVAPDRRRQGIATALLDAALRLCRDQGCPQVLLVVPRQSHAGSALALARGGLLDHSEHALALLTEPTTGTDDPRVRLRPAGPADAGEVSRLLSEGFGTGPAEAPRPGTLLVEVEGAAVGTLRLIRDGDDAGVYGLVVDSGWRGRGIGRDVLRRVCRRLRAEGARRVGLEVAVDNPAALRLYTSLGFTEVTTEDYYAVATQVQ